MTSCYKAFDDNSTVWDGEFASDDAVLDEWVKDICKDGIEAFVGLGKNGTLD